MIFKFKNCSCFPRNKFRGKNKVNSEKPNWCPDNDAKVGKYCYKETLLLEKHDKATHGYAALKSE